MTAAKPETDATLRREAQAIAAALRHLSKRVAELDTRCRRYLKAQKLPPRPRAFTYAEWLASDTARGCTVHKAAREFAETARTTPAQLIAMHERQGIGLEAD